jgi:LemA protein
MISPLIIVLVVIGVLVLWIIGAYNRFIRLINQSKEAWSDIEVQLKRRYELIPNLVNAVKGYMAHESGTFEKVTEARNQAMRAGNLHDKAGAENMLTGALKSLFAVSEAYPDLKANTNFLELQKELSDTENKIQSSRRFYNANVRDLNIGVQSFPANLIAKAFNFSEMELFDLPEGDIAEKNVEVKF